MPVDRLRPPQHFEYRYFIREETCTRLRDFVGEYLELDEYAVGRPDYSYAVDDFYFDSDQWRIYWRLIDVAAQGHYQRLRIYDPRPEAPVYCETKRRIGDRVEKHRAAVPRSVVPWLISGQMPKPSDLPKDAAIHLELERFCQLVSTAQAHPRVHVAFLREAYVSPGGEPVRVTIDRLIRCELLLGGDIAMDMARPLPLFHRQVVLELKFAGRFPLWVEEMSERFGLRPCGAAKFVESVKLVAGPEVAGSDTTFF